MFTLAFKGLGGLTLFPKNKFLLGANIKPVVVSIEDPETKEVSHYQKHQFSIGIVFVELEFYI
jgi:hypothetical protein